MCTGCGHQCHAPQECGALVTFFNTPCGCTYADGRRQWKGCEPHGQLDMSHKEDRQALALCMACQEVTQP